MMLKTTCREATEPGPHLLITGGVHGDEFEPMAAIRQLIASPSLKLLRGKLTLVPVVNEPAFLRGHRAGPDDQDLARTCPGDPNGSTTEQIAHALSALIQAADHYIDLHTGGTTLQVLPMVGYVMHPDPEILEQQRAMARAFNLPIIWGTDHRLPGRSLSVARDCGVPAIYTEYLGGARCDPGGVEAYVKGCLNVMESLEMIDHEPPASRIRHIVEDRRENSGHMQICHRSPLTGYFEPAVQLGEHITAGAPLGTVSDLLGEKREVVSAEQTGLVLVLKTFPRVEQEDALAVILETELDQQPGPG
ncbi:MAG: M14 family metallopeptidase [Pirellulaceae bacterium]|nr:M14 family metallopeptidase [Pirellulaceae bacterium]